MFALSVIKICLTSFSQHWILLYILLLDKRASLLCLLHKKVLLEWCIYLPSVPTNFPERETERTPLLPFAQSESLSTRVLVTWMLFLMFVVQSLSVCFQASCLSVKIHVKMKTCSNFN